MGEKYLQLQPRLQLLADLVPQGARLADIGTDHGYLPVWLLQRGKIAAAIAADIGEEPLQHARRTAEEYGVEGIEFRLCDGLKHIDSREADTVIIAGMGGETIIHILSAAPWTKTVGAVTLLLQPMTKAGELRRWLAVNGYSFTDERLVWDKDFLYPIMVVTGGKQQPLTRLQEEYGVCLWDDPLCGDYLRLQIRKLERTIEGKRHAESEMVQKQADELEELCCELKALQKERC